MDQGICVTGAAVVVVGIWRHDSVVPVYEGLGNCVTAAPWLTRTLSKGDVLDGSYGLEAGPGMTSIEGELVEG